MSRRVVHVSAAEAARDFASLLAQVRDGAEIVIEENAHPIALLQPAEPERRTLSECIARAKAYEEESGNVPVLSPDFAADVEEIVRNRKPRQPSV